MTNISNVSLINNGVPLGQTPYNSNQSLTNTDAANDNTYNQQNVLPFSRRPEVKQTKKAKEKKRKEQKTYSGLSDEELKELDNQGIFKQALETAKDTALYQIGKLGFLGFVLSGFFSTARYILREPYVSDVVSKTPALWRYKDKDGNTYDLREEAFKRHQGKLAIPMAALFKFQEDGKKYLDILNENDKAPINKKPHSEETYKHAEQKLKELRDKINNLPPEELSNWFAFNDEYSKIAADFNEWIDWVGKNQGKHSRNIFPSKHVKKSLELSDDIYVFATDKNKIKEADLPLNLLAQNMFYGLMDSHIKDLKHDKNFSKLTLKALDYRKTFFYRYREHGITLESLINGIEASVLGLSKAALMFTTLLPFTSAYLYAIVDSSLTKVKKFEKWLSFKPGQNKINSFVTVSKAASTALKRTDDPWVFATNLMLGIGRKHFRDVAEDNSPFVLGLMRFLQTGSFKLKEGEDYKVESLNRKFLNKEYKAMNLKGMDYITRAPAKWVVKVFGDFGVIGLGTFIIQALYMLYKKAQLNSEKNNSDKQNKDEENLIDFTKKK